MANFSFTIDSIRGGNSAADYLSTKEQFLTALAIDPDLPRDDSSLEISGLIRPSALAKFSGSTVTGTPLWIITNPKTENIYIYQSNGLVSTVTSGLSMGSDVGTPTGGAGNGAEYYDNYVYFATPTDISRYGPLNGSPSLTNTYWTSTLSLTALTSTTYPSLRGVAIPNHPMHRHTDGKLYFGDVTSGNQGILSYINTSKSSVEGDTNNGSSYNALDFGYGLYPTCIETYQTTLAIGLIEGTGTTINQKPARIAFWDSTSTSFQTITSVELPDPIITALRNVNGVLYVFTGNASGGFRVLRFLGGYTYEEVYYSEDGMPPFAGAVDHLLNRISWGSYVTSPTAAACVFAQGSRKRAIGGGVQTILKATSASTTNQFVSSFKYITHSNNSIPGVIVGWTDNSSKGLDKISTTYGTAMMRTQRFKIGRSFQVKKIRIPFAQAIATNMTLTIKIYVDDDSSNTTIATINNTNFTAAQRRITLYPQVTGTSNFLVEFTWSGTALLTVGYPIVIEGETLND